MWSLGWGNRVTPKSARLVSFQLCHYLVLSVRIRLKGRRALTSGVPQTSWRLVLYLVTENKKCKENFNSSTLPAAYSRKIVSSTVFSATRSGEIVVALDNKLLLASI